MMINQNKLLISVLSFTFSLSINLISDETINLVPNEKYTTHSLNAGFSLNENFYFSNFTEIPNCVSCAKYDSILFDFANGLGYSFWFGYSKYLEKSFFNKNSKFSINLVFSSISAKYSKESKFANYIPGFLIEDLISRHTIDVTLNSIALNPSISIEPISKNNFPLSIGIGANLGILLTGSFSQKEELIEPKYVFFENGEKIINKANGDLPDKASIFAGISLNVTYDFYKIDNFIFSPTLKLNYGLTNIVSNADWKVHSANLGINIAYNIPKKIEVIKEPEIIIQEEIPVVEKLNLIVNASEPNNSKIIIPISLHEIIKTSNSLPILYFQQNTDLLVGDYFTNLEHYERLVKKIKIANENKQNIKIEIGISSSESDSIFEERKNTIITFLHSYKIQTDLLSFEKNVKTKKEKYDEAEKENSYAKFFIDNKLEQLIETTTQKIINNISTHSINFNAIIEATELPYSYILSYTISNYDIIKQNNVALKEIKNVENYNFLIDSNLLNWKDYFEKTNSITEKIDIMVGCFVSDAKDNSKNTTFNYQIEPRITVDTFYNSNPNNLYKSEYILGFFSFDEDEIFAVDTNILNKIRDVLKNGKQIEVVGTTDNLGTQNYNSGLSLLRAKSAIKIIDPENNFANSITVGSKSAIERNFDYSNIYAQQKARVAIIRILN